MKTVIVGGVAGGATAAARLRRLDESAEIVLLEKNAHISFANCGLPYFVGGAIPEQSDLLLQTPESFRARFQVDVRVFHEAVAINRDAHTVQVRTADGATYDEPYDKLVLSPGAAPIVPGAAALDDERIFTLRSVSDAARIRAYVEHAAPRRAVVVGCGFIGLEMTENLVCAGLSVTAVDLANAVLAPLDRDMAAEVHAYLEKQGVTLLLGAGLTAVEKAADGLTVTVGGARLPADLVVLAVGIRPETAFAAEAGLAVNGKGFLITDEHMRTNDPDIYAVGDAVEIKNLVTQLPASVPLAGPANQQARICADNIAGIRSVYHGAQGSSILKLFDMSVASTGLNERTAKALSIPYERAYTFSPSHASYYPGSTDMSVKTLYEPVTGRILGAQIVGFDGVDKCADLLAAAVRMRMCAQDLCELELCYAPPFSSAKSPVNVVGYVIQNTLNGLVRPFFWDDVPRFASDPDAVLLDVRTEREYAKSHIDGFRNIPLHLLRTRAQELPAGRTVYVCCRSGLRSYVACRILSGLGYPCKNLAGGYRFWEIVTNDLARHPEAKAPNAPESTLLSLARDYFHKNGLSCSESTIELLQRIGKISDDPALTQSMSGFGGGMHRGLACGAVVGAVAALGAHSGRHQRGASKEPLNSEVEAFLNEFEKRYGALTCAELTGQSGLSQAEQHAVCTHYVAAAVEIAAAILDGENDDNA